MGLLHHEALYCLILSHNLLKVPLCMPSRSFIHPLANRSQVSDTNCRAELLRCGKLVLDGGKQLLALGSVNAALLGACNEKYQASLQVATKEGSQKHS